MQTASERMKHSNSSLKLYAGCPARYKFLRIDKLPEGESDAANRGVDIHKVIEGYVLGTGQLTEPLSYMAPLLDDLRSRRAEPEVPFSMTRDWEPVAFDDERARFRGIIDLLVPMSATTLTLLDWKSGKERDYSSQLRRYSAVTLEARPRLASIEMGIYYTDLRKSKKHGVMKQGEQVAELAKLDMEMTKVENDKTFAPNPSDACRWCHFRRGNGGPCRWG
jgi:RecB family exonuclease